MKRQQNFLYPLGAKKKKNSLKSANSQVKTKRKSKYKSTDYIQQEPKEQEYRCDYS